MKEIIQFESFQLEIWRRARQRSLRLSVRVDGRLRVTCNRGVAKRDILRFVGESRDFIVRRMSEVENLRKKHPPKRYLSGETLLFLGEPLRVEVVWTWTSRIEVLRRDTEFEILAPLASSVVDRSRAIEQHYRREGRRYLTKRLCHWIERTGMRPRALAIRGQNTRWGSCTSGGLISLNWKLLATPPDVIDYVIVHELAHLQHMNHSPRFWQAVERWLPNYRDLRRRLKDLEMEVGLQFQRQVHCS
jgi:predicted metal-dependent hydrolase